MKKIIVILFIAILGYYGISQRGATLLIPNEAIRFRVLANSNSKEDQNLKLKVKEEIQLYLFELLKNTKGIENARMLIEKNIPNIQAKVDRTLQKYDSHVNYDVNFGLNYFPNKKYKGVVYPEGKYESLVITLGEGKGNNWWCVLFPPLCLMEAEESEEVEYTSFFQELIEKYL